MTGFVDENSTSAKDAVNPNLSEKSGFTAFFAESAARARARGNLVFFVKKRCKSNCSLQITIVLADCSLLFKNIPRKNWQFATIGSRKTSNECKLLQVELSNIRHSISIVNILFFEC